MRFRRLSGVVAVYFGEGASSEGDFHEASNLAGVMRVPLVMLLINNHYAISTPLHRQTAAHAFVDKAVGYGIVGVSVDGNDVLAVYEATRNAVAHAREGHGPTLIECRTMRVRGHSEADKYSYVPAPLLDEWRARDPILL